MGKKLIAVILGALTLRLVLYTYLTYNLDLYTFVSWAKTLTEGGLGNFYTVAWSDYLPGYLYILWLLGSVQKLVAIDTVLLFKLPAMLADIVTGLVIYAIASKVKNKRAGLLVAALYVFNPAVIANSTLWGQADSFTALFSLLTVYFFGPLPVVSAVALALGTLIKPTAAFVAPVILVLMVKNRWKLPQVLGYGVVGAIVFLAGFLPFATGNPFAFVLARVLATTNQYPYGSVNAFNFWGLWGFWQPDMTIGLTFFIPLVFIGVEAVRSWKKDDLAYRLLAVGLTSTFLFVTRMHERHLLPALAPLAIVAISSPPAYVAYFGFSFTYLLNLYYSFSIAEGPRTEVLNGPTIKLLISINLVLFANLLLGLWEKVLTRLNIPRIESLTRPLPQLTVRPNLGRALLVLILGFALGTRVFGLAHPAKEYFDEVYHAFTARMMLTADPKAWEWWNESPKGYAYEWTHPPFAKLAMVGGMTIFGENSFGWRIPGALFGVGVVYLIYLIARRLFHDQPLALLAAGIAALDGLLLVLSRTGMNDIYFVFFALCTFYFFVTDKHLAAAVALGLAAASKWSVVWLIPILFAVHLSHKKKLKWSYLWFLVVPPLVYLASYLPMFTAQHSWEQFIEVQRQMWWYHSHLKATHDYQSQWWSWPLMLRPVWFYASRARGLVENIYAMGNPFIFWSGIVSVGVASLTAWWQKNKNLGLMVFAYLAFFVPWAASPRIMFLYHYLPAVPFMVIILAYILRKFPTIIMPAFVLFGLAFGYFYPHWTGIGVPEVLSNSYYWLTSWK